MSSREMKDISFSMFNDKTEFMKERWNNIVATKKIGIQKWNGFVLRNK